jgi:hypothetical protein
MWAPGEPPFPDFRVEFCRATRQAELDTKFEPAPTFTAIAPRSHDTGWARGRSNRISTGHRNLCGGLQHWLKQRIKWRHRPSTTGCPGTGPKPPAPSLHETFYRSKHVLIAIRCTGSVGSRRAHQAFRILLSRFSQAGLRPGTIWVLERSRRTQRLEHHRRPAAHRFIHEGV